MHLAVQLQFELVVDLAGHFAVHVGLSVQIPPQTIVEPLTPYTERLLADVDRHLVGRPGRVVHVPRGLLLVLLVLRLGGRLGGCALGRLLRLVAGRLRLVGIGRRRRRRLDDRRRGRRRRRRRWGRRLLRDEGHGQGDAERETEPDPSQRLLHGVAFRFSREGEVRGGRQIDTSGRALSSAFRGVRSRRLRHAAGWPARPGGPSAYAPPRRSRCRS